MKKNTKYFLLAFVLLAFYSCKKSSDKNNGNDPTPKPPTPTEVTITTKPFKGKISEVAEPNTVIGKMAASASDQSPVTFSLEDDLGGLLALDSKSGELTLVEPKLLDYSKTPVIKTNFIATNGTVSGKGAIEIEVEDAIRPFITTWKVDSGKLSVKIKRQVIPSDPRQWDFTIFWGDGKKTVVNKDAFGYTIPGDFSHTYASEGTYTISVSGTKCPGLELGNIFQPNTQIVSIEQWGDIEWEEMSSMFGSCENLQYNAKDAPNLDKAKNLASMFSNIPTFNADISNWDVSNVEDMSSMFYATSFDQDISGWNVANVKLMNYMLGACPFNQDISGWTLNDALNCKDFCKYNPNLECKNLPNKIKTGCGAADCK